jgi:glyoxylase-like metal-dependent hydrolase (beta-lactamase superfamily II)
MEFSPELEWVARGVRRLRLPVPFPLRWVNLYVLEDGGGPVLVDAGYPIPEARALLWEALHRTGLRPEVLLVTHAHPDHFGLAAELQERLGCPVWMAREEWVAAQTYQPGMPAWDQLAAELRAEGMPPERVRATVDSGQRIWAHTPPPSVQRFLGPDEELDLGGGWQVLVTPGHAPAHVCLFQPETGTLVAGDHLLPKISPNIGRWPAGSPDPLDDFLRSLAGLRGLPVRRVLPGHGDPYSEFAERLQELTDHHRQRLQAVLETVREAPRTGYEVCVALFGSDLDSHNERFAMVETLSHLTYLERRGRLRRTEDGRYRAS